MKKLLLLFVLLLAFATPNFAKTKTVNPWIHCGLGAALFTEELGSFYKWGAIISNLTFDFGTTAIISATISPQTCNGLKDAVAAQFIFETLPQLEEQTALGSGQYTDTVFSIYGCNSSDFYTKTQTLRSDFSKKLQTKSYQNSSHLEKSKAYHNIISKVAKSCTVI